MPTQPTVTPKAILFSWCKHKGITPSDLMRAIGCTYNHAWRLIQDPDYPITPNTLGNLLIKYGQGGPAPAIADAMRLQPN